MKSRRTKKKLQPSSELAWELAKEEHKNQVALGHLDVQAWAWNRQPGVAHVSWGHWRAPAKVTIYAYTDE